MNLWLEIQYSDESNPCPELLIGERVRLAGQAIATGGAVAGIIRDTAGKKIGSYQLTEGPSTEDDEELRQL